MRYLLDTCVISELTKKKPEQCVKEWILQQEEMALFLSVITLGEIEKGIMKLDEGSKKRKLRHWVDHDLMKRFGGRVLQIDYETACRWGEISAKTEQAGTPTPVLDGLLAATAMVHDLILVTRNIDDVLPTGVPLENPWGIGVSQCLNRN